MEDDIDYDELNEDKMSFKWGEFDGTSEGPLDVLLMLIKKSKVEIMDIELSKITEQFLEYMTNTEMDMNLSSAFLEEATRLIEIKSKKLLPKLIDETDTEEDEEWLYKIRLQEYKLFKENADNLRSLENVDKFYKSPEEDAGKFRIVIKDMQLDMLLDAFTRILAKSVKKESAHESKVVQKEVFTVEQKVSQIKDSLIVRKSVKFQDLFTENVSKDELVTTFMALLELLKLQTIKVSQGAIFGEIIIEKNEGEYNG